jgi:hypothetical protein
MALGLPAGISPPPRCGRRGGEGGERGGGGGEGRGCGGAGGGAHVRARVRACTRRLTCPLLPNANNFFDHTPGIHGI